MKNSTLGLILAVAIVGVFTGCAAMQPHNSKSELTAAGFKVRKPDTAKKREVYDSLTDGKLGRANVNGKIYYVFKDEKAGVAYVGGETEHQRYQQICQHDHTEAVSEENMDKATASKYHKYWGVGATLF
jgi:hypothetical protein